MFENLFLSKKVDEFFLTNFTNAFIILSLAVKQLLKLSKKGGRKMEEAVKLLIDKVTDISNTQEKMLRTQEKMLKTQEEMKKAQDEMQKDFQAMVKRQDRMEETQKEMQEELTKMQEEVTRIGNTVTIMENEHSQKIDLILEVVVGHNEKLEELEEKHEKNKRILDMHGHRIYALEQQREN